MSTGNYRKISIMLIVCILGAANISSASSLEQYLNYDQRESNTAMLFAANQGPASFDYGDKNPSDDYCWMSAGKAHKYLGYGTLLMAVAAGVSGGDNGFHKGAGVGAAVLGVAACGTGFYEYDNYLDFNEGLSGHNIHIVLGTLAAAGFVAVAASAISQDDSSHAGIGVASTALTAIPIIVLKF